MNLCAYCGGEIVNQADSRRIKNIGEVHADKCLSNSLNTIKEAIDVMHSQPTGSRKEWPSSINLFYMALFKKSPSAIKRFLLRRRGAAISDSSRIHKNSEIMGNVRELKLGDNAIIGENNCLVIGGPVIFENNIKLSDGVRIGPGFQCETSFLIMGENSTIGTNSTIDTSGGVEIGRNVTITSEVSIFTHNHGKTKDQPIMSHTEILEGTKIGDGSFIGFRSIILGGVEIAEGAIVGAGAVVTKNVLPYSIVAGNPAGLIGKRITDDEDKRQK